MADVLYDCTLVLELLLGFAWFKSYSNYLLCLATGLRSVVIVAGSASSAAIVQHQVVDLSSVR